MEECFKCGVFGSSVRLFDAISDEGIVKICDLCSIRENIPVVKKTNDFLREESFEKQTVYDRLAKTAGIDASEHRKKFSSDSEKRAELLKKQSTTLRDLVDANYKKSLNVKQRVPVKDMVDNFHWILMRNRRIRKLTCEQIAKEINEPEIAIKMAEKGVLPIDSNNFVKKLEKYFNVRLLKNSVSEKKSESEITFNPILDDDLTISDLQEQAKERVPYWKRKFGFLMGRKEKTSEEIAGESAEMSDEELKRKVENDLSKEMDEILGKSE